MASSVSKVAFMSWVFAPVMTAERGVPLWSVRMCLFVPSLALSVGLGPVLSPERRLDRTRVERLPSPLDSPQLVVLPEEPDPQLLEDPFADPLLAVSYTH